MLALPETLMAGMVMDVAMFCVDPMMEMFALVQFVVAAGQTVSFQRFPLGEMKLVESIAVAVIAPLELSVPP